MVESTFSYLAEMAEKPVYWLCEPPPGTPWRSHRVAVANVWKPIRGPVQTTPLAVCDARSIAPDDFVLTDLRYSDRTGEIQSLRFNPAHRWFYYPAMQADEVLLLECYDSDRTVARFTAHSAFDDPMSPADAPARESIEVRTLAFFAPAS